MSIGATAFKLGFEISPIILVNGIASAIPGQMLPIVAITEASSFVSGLLHGSIDIDLDSYFAHFSVIPGGQLANNQIGSYPFANQTVAANAMIAQPLNVSLLMRCPVSKAGGYVSKLLTITALQAALQKHTFMGGTYTIATPSFVYTNCVLLGLKDVSTGESKQVQTEWQFDFQQPLIAIADANLAMNSLMGKIAGGLPQVGLPSWSGASSAVSSAADSVAGAASGIVTGANNLIGTSVSSAAGVVTSSVPTPNVTVTQL